MFGKKAIYTIGINYKALILVKFTKIIYVSYHYYLDLVDINPNS